MSNTYLPFLQEVANILYNKYQDELNNLAIIFPSQRAGMFFQKYLAKKIEKPIWAPKIISIEHFIQELSPLQVTSTLTLVHSLYKVLRSFQYQKETFEQFYTWGVMLLHDFDAIDKYLVQAEHLFKNLYHEKQLLTTYDYLTNNQRTSILSFWKSFDKRLSEDQHNFLQLWELLPQVYKQFRTELIAEKKGYQGLCYRTAWEGIIAGDITLPNQHFIFVGFNALNKIEENIIIWCKKNRNTDYYWDLDAYYMEDKQQEAGEYLRTHQQNEFFKDHFGTTYPQRIAGASKIIQINAVASEVGQVQIIIDQLQQLIHKEGKSFNPIKTAIIVADEQFLLPLLHGLPIIKHPIHITFGYPLSHTTVYNILEQLLILQKNIEDHKYPNGYLSTKDILAIIQQLELLLPTYISNIKDFLHQLTITTYIQEEIITNYDEIFGILFRVIPNSQNIINYIDKYISLIGEQLINKKDTIAIINQLACNNINQQLANLKEIGSYGSQLGDFIKFFLHLLQIQRLPFNKGATYSGIQVTNILETKALDFDHIFILGMNEGIFPNSKHQPSFIPYNLRKGYNLPTADQYQVALYAYHFYRLLQRSQDVFITYSTKSTLKGQGEMSRFLWQLCYESNLPIQKKYIAPTPAINKITPIIIYKDNLLLAKLNQFLVHNKQKNNFLTPSALNTYLSCSLKFYFQHIVKLKIPDRLPKRIDRSYFGIILHKVMEKLYTPFVKKKGILTKGEIIQLKGKITKVVKITLLDVMYSSQVNLFISSHSQHAIVQASIEHLVNRILSIDVNYAPFSMIGLEIGKGKELCTDLKLDGTKKIQLGGIIDRIDQKKDIIRIIDYKTDTINNRFTSINSLFDPNTLNHNAAALQILFYAWLFKRNYQGLPVTIIPGIISSKSTFDYQFDPTLFIKEERKPFYTPIHDISPYEIDLEEGIRQVLQRIFDPGIPFSQTNNLIHCIHCPYKNICQRG